MSRSVVRASIVLAWLGTCLAQPASAQLYPPEDDFGDAPYDIRIPRVVGRHRLPAQRDIDLSYPPPLPDEYSDYGPPPGRDRVSGGDRVDVTGGETTKRTVEYATSQPAGTIVIDTRVRKLFVVLGGGTALEYGVGVGRQGFAWKGIARVGRKAEWPRWIPPADMLRRRPELPTSMEGGIDNPLGARALYLFQGKNDTLFRIHGTNEPDTIGHAVSSGCIRMLNADVVDLYGRIPAGTRVVVL